MYEENASAAAAKVDRWVARKQRALVFLKEAGVGGIAKKLRDLLFCLVDGCDVQPKVIRDSLRVLAHADILLERLKCPCLPHFCTEVFEGASELLLLPDVVPHLLDCDIEPTLF